jgi:hypothetical protein
VCTIGKLCISVGASHKHPVGHTFRMRCRIFWKRLWSLRSDGRSNGYLKHEHLTGRVVTFSCCSCCNAHLAVAQCNGRTPPVHRHMQLNTESQRRLTRRRA